MRLVTAVIALSSCLGCVVERDIGSAAIVPGTENGGLIPPMRLGPPPFSNNPCCLVRDPMALDDASSDVQGGPPSVVAMDGSPGWGVVWQDMKQQRTMIRIVDNTPGSLASFAPTVPGLITGVARYSIPGFVLTPPVPSTYRFAIAMKAPGQRGSPNRDSQMRLVALDDFGALQAETAIAGGSEGGVFASLGNWLAMIALDHSQGPTDLARLFVLEGDLTPLDSFPNTADPFSPVDLGPSLPDVAFAPSILRSLYQLVTVVTAPDGVHVRAFGGPGRGLVDEPHPEVIVDVGRVGSVSAAVIYERVIIAAMDHETIRTWVYDPETGTVLGGPFTVSSGPHQGRLKMRGGSGSPTAGLCYSVGDRPGSPDSLRFALIAEDGKPRGVPVDVASGLDHVADCDVGPRAFETIPDDQNPNISAGFLEKYLVTYWNAAKQTAGPSMFANQIIVQRGNSSPQ
jgi:hypothetical protein